MANVYIDDALLGKLTIRVREFRRLKAIIDKRKLISIPLFAANCQYCDKQGKECLTCTAYPHANRRSYLKNDYWILLDECLEAKTKFYDVAIEIAQAITPEE